MRIAFDFDGVIRAMDLGFLKKCLEDKSYEAIKIHTFISQPLLNPFLFATKEDEVYIISNCLTEDSVTSKREWINHFFGNRVRFYYTLVAAGGWKKEYCDPVAKAKVDLMLKLGIEVYFDDDPAIIRVMRSLTDKIKFIKYGPWIEEYY